MALLTNLVAGLFFLVGAGFALFGKKRRGIIEFSIGLSFSVMVLLLAFDIVPEILELLEDRGTVFMYVFIIIGIVLLKLIDFLVPHHDHDEEIKTHHRHIHHIGIISALALIIHNIIEGIGIYNIAMHDFKTGMIMAIGVGLHNIPFGIEITATLMETKNKKYTIAAINLLSFSTLLGGVAIMVFKSISDFVLGSLMSLTVGMIIYLVIFELLIELGASKNRKYSVAGLFTGILFMLGVLIIGG